MQIHRNRDPLWLAAFVRVAPPLIATVVLAISAPGEAQLARAVGWSPGLAWGMPAALAAYAGLSAAVAGQRAPGTPGASTARLGALLAIGGAIVFQGIAHTITTGHLTTVPLWLVWAVSAVPGLVLGHLLHVAASASRPAPEPDTEWLAPHTPEEAPSGPPGGPAVGAAAPAPAAVSVAVAAASLGVGERAVRARISSGQLPATRTATGYQIPTAALAAAMSN